MNSTEKRIDTDRAIPTGLAFLKMPSEGLPGDLKPMAAEELLSLLLRPATLCRSNKKSAENSVHKFSYRPDDLSTLDRPKPKPKSKSKKSKSIKENREPVVLPISNATENSSSSDDDAFSLPQIEQSSKIICTWPFFSILENQKSSIVPSCLLQIPPQATRADIDWADREIEFLQNSEHPGLLKILSYDKQTGRGQTERIVQTLADKIQQEGELTVPAAQRLLKSAMSALSVYHQRGLIHAELDVDRIVLDSEGKSRIGGSPGFRCDGELRPQRNKNRCIAPELLSPDQFGKVTPAVDIYAMGHVILQALLGSRYYEVLKTQSMPLENGSTFQWHGSVDDHFPPLNSLLPNLPEMTSILEKMIAKPVRSRYSSVEQVLADLAKEAPLDRAEPAQKKKTAQKLAKPIIAINDKKLEPLATQSDSVSVESKIQKRSYKKKMIAVLATLAALLFGLILFSDPVESEIEASLMSSSNDVAEPNQPMLAKDGLSFDEPPENLQRIEVPSIAPPVEGIGGAKLDGLKNHNHGKEKGEIAPSNVDPNLLSAEFASHHKDPSGVDEQPEDTAYSFIDSIKNGVFSWFGEAAVGTAPTNSDSNGSIASPAKTNENDLAIESSMIEDSSIQPPIAESTPRSKPFITPDFRINSLIESPDPNTSTAISDIRSIFQDSASLSEIKRQLDEYYQQYNLAENPDYRIELLISFGFEKRRQNKESLAWIEKGIHKVQRLVDQQPLTKDEPGLLVDWGLRFKPELQRMRLKVRSRSSRELRNLVTDCYQLVNQLSHDYDPTRNRKTVEEIATFIACVLKQIEFDNHQFRARDKVPNLLGSFSQIQADLFELDPRIGEHFAVVIEALEIDGESVLERLEFLTSLNLDIEMDSILKSFPRE